MRGKAEERDYALVDGREGGGKKGSEWRKVCENGGKSMACGREGKEKRKSVGEVRQGENEEMGRRRTGEGCTGTSERREAG